MSHEIYLKTRAFGSLDGLRALSILAVIWLHTANNHSSGLPFLARGFLGVDFFFVISGFLIATLLLRERRQSGTISLASFYARRTLRIIPAYWLMLALVLGMAYVKPGAQSAAIKHDLPYAFLYVSNFVAMGSLLSITWSLSTEEQFYLVIPYLQKYAPRIFAKLLLPVGYVLAALPALGALPHMHLPEFFRQTTFAPILLGVALAYALNSAQGWRAAARVLGSRYSPLVALGLLALAANIPLADISGAPRLAMQALMAVLLASCVVREDHALRNVLNSWPLRRIGIVSYGMYLYHLLVYWPAARLLARLGVQSDYLFFVAVMLGTWAVAEVSFRLFEAKFLKLKRRFSTRRTLVAV